MLLNAWEQPYPLGLAMGATLLVWRSQNPWNIGTGAVTLGIPVILYPGWGLGRLPGGGLSHRPHCALF